MRRGRSTRLTGALVAGLLSTLLGPWAPAQSGGITYIGFEDLPAVCSPFDGVPLRGRYAAAKFKGPSAEDGAAVLDECAGLWGTPRTGTRFLVVSGYTMDEGGRMIGPVKIQFPTPQKKVTVWVSQGDINLSTATFKMVARRKGAVVRTATATTPGPDYVPLTVKSARKKIDAVTITGPTSGDSQWFLDDLTMVS